MANLAEGVGVDDWSDLLNPDVITGWSAAPDHGSGGLHSTLHSPTREGNHAPIWSPENPIFWLGAILVLATGFVYVSTSVKLGPVKASVKA
jgi:hypothetical protein